MTTHHAHAHSHSHGHGHEDIDWDELADQLERQARAQLGFLRETAAWLGPQLPSPQALARVLDIGSGPGAAAAVFAEAFPDAEVIAVDGTPGLLERAAARGVTTRLAELPGELDTLGTADLVWAARVVHHLGDQQAALNALAHRVRPGGLLAISEGGLPPRFLPRDIGIGRPGLQARLDVANEEWFTAMRAALPDAADIIEDWPAMLARAGLTPVATRSFLTELRPPLDDDARELIHGHLARSREVLADVLDPDDVHTLDALLDPDAPTGIRRRADAFYLTATTVHTARRE
ncbi:class I SAM-dependent methyltransferase [Streptomyces sp. 6N223]|uniref:class I SAM-dependent methyltransferase n=1 Tax=Streptomyces sp. 6N223 TaxID=3457412 RepID=UPI003FD32476